MPDKVTTLTETEGQPIVEVIIGHANFGNYEVRLWNAEATAFIVVGDSSTDPVFGNFNLPLPVADLHGKALQWIVGIQSPDGGAGQSYSLTIRVKQKDKIVLGGEISVGGALDGAKLIVDFVRITVV